MQSHTNIIIRICGKRFEKRGGVHFKHAKKKYLKERGGHQHLRCLILRSRNLLFSTTDSHLLAAGRQREPEFWASMEPNKY